MDLPARIAEGLRLYKLSRCVNYATQVGLFRTLAAGPSMVRDLASAARVSEDTMAEIVAALKSSGFLDVRDGVVSLPSPGLTEGDAERLEHLARYHAEAERLWLDSEKILSGELPPKSLGDSNFARGALAAVFEQETDVLRVLTAKLPRSPEVLDVGGGSGIGAGFVLSVRPKAHVTILDPLWYGDEELLSDPRVSWRRSHKNLVVRNFDLILCINTLHALTVREADGIFSWCNKRLYDDTGLVVVQEFIPSEPPFPFTNWRYLRLAQLLRNGKSSCLDIADVPQLFERLNWRIVAREILNKDYVGYASCQWLLRKRSQVGS